ncbi:MAG: tRNA-dihydrouridine synthase [Verrucomicrobia bacterium]|nr:tRNA-dihydrouridine synthase [Verrucomicrobiota bacterium]
MLNRPITVGALALPNRVFLAPLAGVSDSPFRRLCTEQGAGLAYVEMLAANAVLHANQRTRRTMARDASEIRLGVQVTGSCAGEIAEAIRWLDDEGFDTIDINMGCPVRKIVGKGLGCALLKQPDVVSRTVTLARAATTKPLSVKIRIGYSRSEVNVADIARRCADAGADMLTIHGRVRDDTYATPVDVMAIREGVRSVRAAGRTDMCVVANGDVLSPAAAREMLRQTGCDAVMISRGALGNPWIFRAMLATGTANVGAAEWSELVQRHFEWHSACYGHGRHAVARFRKQLLWYVQGFTGARQMRELINHIEDPDQLRAAISNFAASIPEGETRSQAFSLELNQERTAGTPAPSAATVAS